MNASTILLVCKLVCVQHLPLTSSLIVNVLNSLYPSSFILLLLDIGDACLVAPNIHRGTHVMAGDGPQLAKLYKIIKQENLGVSCTYLTKYYKCYPTD